MAKTTKPVPRWSQELKRAMKRKGMGARALSAAVQERLGARRGTSYGGIRAYLSGTVRHPRYEILEAAAAVLDIPIEVLTGEVQMPPLAGERSFEDFFDEWSERQQSMMDLMAQRIGVQPGSAERWLLFAWRRFFFAQPFDPSEGNDERAAHAVADAVAAPLNKLGIDPATLTLDDLESYAVAMLPALERLAGPWAVARAAQRLQEELTALETEAQSKKPKRGTARTPAKE